MSVYALFCAFSARRGDRFGSRSRGELRNTAEWSGAAARRWRFFAGGAVNEAAVVFTFVICIENVNKNKDLSGI